MGVADIDPLITEEQLEVLIRTFHDSAIENQFIQTRHKSKSGQIIDVEITTSLIELGGVRYHISIATDITQKRQAAYEHALLKFAFDHNHDNAFLIEESGRFLYVNHSLCKRLGYTQKELLSMYVFDVNPDTMPHEWYAHWQALKNVGSLVFESHNQHKDGTVFPVEISTNYFEFDGKGYNIGVSKDITERKQMESELIKRRELYRLLAESIPANIILVDTEGRYLYVNAIHANTISNIPAEDFIGKTVDELFPDGRFSDLKAIIDQVTNTKKAIKLTKIPNAFEDRVQELHDIHFIPHLDQDDNVQSVLGIGFDMSDYYQLQEELITKEEQLRHTVETLPGAVGILHLHPNKTASIPYMSPNAKELFGIGHEAVIRQASLLLRRIHPQYSRNVKKGMVRSLHDLSLWREEFIFVHPHKRDIWLECQAMPVKHADGGVMWFGYVQDISERKNFEKQIGLASIGQLSAGITHEINTPLTYIKGRIELMKYSVEAMSDGDIKSEMLHDLRSINEGIVRMSLIIESMREIAGKSKGIKEPVNLYSSFITILVMIHNRAKYIAPIYLNGTLFTLDMPKNANTYSAYVEKQRIEQVWIIMLNNALDALSQHDFDRNRIDITLKASPSDTMIQIEDNGGGIPDEILPIIFDPFTSTKEHGGMGLGLNIAKRIINEQHGRIRVENSKKGALLTIILPKEMPH